MRLRPAIIAILFIADQPTQVQSLVRYFPRAIVDLTKVYHHDGSVNQKIRRDADAILNHALYNQRDVIPPPTPVDPATAVTSPPTESASSDDPSTWENKTELTCRDALSKSKADSIDPSGMAACYNVRYFNNSTGVFQSELRFYRLSPPTGNWAALDSKGLSVGLSYKGASLGLGGNMNNRKQDEGLVFGAPMRKAPRQTMSLRRKSDTFSPEKLQGLTFVGKIHDEQMGKSNDPASARVLLTPTISLSGTAVDGTKLRTELSPQNSSFLNGAFSGAQTKDSSSSTILNASSVTVVPVATFVMPGSKLGIFPVGFIITMVWTLLFVVAVGVGTVDRIRFREAYRRRVKRDISIGLRTI